MVKLQVQGSKIASEPLIMNVDTIYVHTDVNKIEPTEDESGIKNNDLYSYIEYQYTYPEFKESYSDVVALLEDDIIDKYTLLLIEKGVL